MVCISNAFGLADIQAASSTELSSFVRVRGKKVPMLLKCARAVSTARCGPRRLCCMVGDVEQAPDAGTGGGARAGAGAGAGKDVDTDVLIVGGGPSGMVLSALLSRLGVRSILLEQRANPTKHPQAHFVGVRTMEILRGLGVFDGDGHGGHGGQGIGLGSEGRLQGLDALVRAASPPREHWRCFRYCTAMVGGIDLGAAQHFSAAGTGASADELTSVDVQLDAASPAGVAHLAQVSNQLQIILLSLSLSLCLSLV